MKSEEKTMKETLLDKVNPFKALAARSTKTVAQNSDLDLNKETALSNLLKPKKTVIYT